MFGRTAIPIVAAAMLGLLCNNSSAEDGDRGHGIGFCSARDPNAGLSKRNYQLVQYEYVWKPEEGIARPTQETIQIGVFFIDGTDEQKGQVKEYAQEWIDKSGIPVEWIFGNQEKKHIRITFEGLDNWSWYGNETLRNTKNEATMHLGVYNEKPPPSAERIRGTILHEFGHALGLMHEHLHPSSGLHFHEKVIFQDLRKSKWCLGDWSDAECTTEMRRQITRPTTEDHACVGAPTYDPRSIMHYKLFAGWTDEYPDDDVPDITDLSRGDLDCVRSLYRSIERPAPPPRLKPDPDPPTGSYPPVESCYCNRGCTGADTRNLCTMPWPRLPPRWVRHFWDDDW